ncbi:hypothetical protein HY496_03420 [Candidatus Woesearchaeota archaeon]|nr:hypothetical protein [Candidatus Woesearchaeota archaeon]
MNTREQTSSGKRRNRGVLPILAVLFFLIGVMPMAIADVALTTFSVEPETIMPGEEITLRLTIENSADDDAKHVFVALDLAALPFAPVETASTAIIDEIDDRDRESVSLRIKALPTAQPGIYKIPVFVTQNAVSKTSLISVEVKAKAALDVLLEDTAVLITGSTGSIPLQFINNGLIQITSLKVTLQESPYYEIVSASSRYIGDVDIGDFETEEFSILSFKEDPIIALHLEYRDSNNNVFSETKLLPLKVYSVEEAETQGLVQKKSSLSLLIGVVVVVGLVFWWRRTKRKRNHAG